MPLKALQSSLIVLRRQAYVMSLVKELDRLTVKPYKGFLVVCNRVGYLKVF
nr:MAG TPA: hypothetical protein [Caudoviricetes sp.]